ncbi:MAG: hypothetical protein AVDCRST_MAG64-4160, partial [uncultured Phycisphaerae bacterium]
ARTTDQEADDVARGGDALRRPGRPRPPLVRPRAERRRRGHPADRLPRRSARALRAGRRRRPAAVRRRHRAELRVRLPPRPPVRAGGAGRRRRPGAPSPRGSGCRPRGRTNRGTGATGSRL